MSETLDPTLNGLNDCGCCAGITAETPAAIRNREGLDQLEYRVGTHGSFKRSMLAALSEAGHPKLQALTTRADDDFSIALLDACATTLDVLTFYQERLANESYLRTATEHSSILRLARLIGYELKPGIAASTWLAFTLETAPGAPEKAIIAAGAKVQSVPGQDEKPQTFETVEDLEARAEWNAMRPQIVEPVSIHAGLDQLYLKGSATQLQPGDAILLVGNERENSVTAQEWSVRIVVKVKPDAQQDWTLITFNKALDAGRVPQSNIKVFAFRQRAAQFGHNAPDPRYIVDPNTGNAVGKWENFKPDGSSIDLDTGYPKVVARSWIAMVGASGGTSLYNAAVVSFPTRTEFAMSGKVTRIKPDTTGNLLFFGLQETIVYAESEQLQLTSPPHTTRESEAPSKSLDLDEGTLAPVEGTRIALEQQVTAFATGRTLIVTGKRIRAKVALSAPALTLTDDIGSQSKPLKPGDTLVVQQLPAVQSNNTVIWRLRHDDGFDGTLTTGLHDLVLANAAKTDAFISERVAVNLSEGNPTQILLNGAGLEKIYDRATVSIAGNVARGTHGETVEEFAGSGDATQVFQKFTLRQGPLTFVRTSKPPGFASTLQVRVDDLLWRKVPFLYRRKPDERIYLERLGDEQKTTVHFGDGIIGARLPSGQQNIRLKYRKGSGLEGLVKAGQLSQLLTRPLGVKEVVNPLPAEGADEAESLSDARQNAPLTVLTLERVVSLQDYEDFARAYPGVAKVLATWTWDGRKRGVFLTVAGPKGAAVTTGPGSVGSDLLEALRAAGDSFVPLRIETYRQASFKVAGMVAVHPDYEKEKVLAAAREELRTRFSFAARAFGQPVLLSEVIGVLHSVKGVVAVDVDHLQRTDKTEPENPAPRLLAEFPGGGAGGDVQAAELLLLAPGNLEEIKAAS